MLTPNQRPGTADRASEVIVHSWTALRLPASRSLRAGILFTGATFVVIRLWLQFQWGGNHLTTVMDDITQIVAPFFAAGCCVYAGIRTAGRRRLDTSVVNSASARGELSAVARTILDLSRNLHVEAIAEGIERDEQAQTFRERECKLGQGFLFAPRMAPEDVEAFIRQHSPPNAEFTLVGSA